MIVDGYIVNINVVCTVKLEATRPISMRPRPDAMRPRSRPDAMRPRLRPIDLASRPHGPRGLNITGSR